MGCWSESCVISGLPIYEYDEVYVATLIKPKFRNIDWVISLPPIKGLYDDYGGIKLLESNKQFKLVSGEDFEITAIRELGQPVYIAASVFELLKELKMEFPFLNSKKVKDLGDFANNYILFLQEQLDKKIVKAETNPIIFTKSGKDIIFKNYYLAEIFGHDDIQADCCKHIQEKLDINDKDFSDFFEFYKRAILLVRGSFELRRALVPTIRGPQHGGENALYQLYNHVFSVINERLEERKAADGDY